MIPSRGLVRLVRERGGGAMAALVEVDKRRQTAVVRLLDDEDDTRVVHFDDICEFVE